MYGSASAEFSDLFSSGQRAWAFAPQITIPIFNAGRNKANLDLARLRKDMAVAAYEQSIQNAFREVSDALVSMDTLKREEAAQQVLVNSTATSLRLSEARYQSGADDHLRLLDAQRTDFASQMALVEIQTQRQISQTALFRALGGVWHGEKNHALSAVLAGGMWKYRQHAIITGSFVTGRATPAAILRKYLESTKDPGRRQNLLPAFTGAGDQAGA